MAKEKKKLMIPFTYYHEEMIDYSGYNYEEGRQNASKIWWDTEENRQVRQPNPPHEPPETFSCGWYRNKDEWQIEVDKYPIRLEKYNEDWKEFNSNRAVGKIIEVDNIVWKENYEFDDTLELTGMSRGRSAANFNLRSVTDNKNYNLFMTDTVDLIQNGVVNKGKITGKWTFCKRGANYGIKLLP